MAVARKEAFTSDMRGKGEEFFKTELPELPEKKKTVLFVSPHQKQGFKVPVRGEDGKIMMQTKPGTNMPVIINGRPVPMLADRDFLLQSNNIKRGCLSYYETDDPYEIEILTKLAEDPTTQIMTEETYLKKKDPINHKLRKEMETIKTTNATLMQENAKKSDIIADLEAQLEALTKPKGK